MVNAAATHFGTPWANSGKHRMLAPDSCSVQFSLVAQSCPTLCNPVDCSTPGFPVHHQLPELVQTHIHWVSAEVHRKGTVSTSPGFVFPIRREALNSLTWDTWFSLINSNLLMVWLGGICCLNSYVSGLPPSSCLFWECNLSVFSEMMGSRLKSSVFSTE